MEDDTVYGMQMSEYKRLRFLFFSLDASGDGSLDPTELQKGLSNEFGLSISAKEAEDMVRRADSDGNGTVEWDEFLEMMSATMVQAVERSEDGEGEGEGKSGATGLESWLESWLPRLAQMRIVAQNDKKAAGAGDESESDASTTSKSVRKKKKRGHRAKKGDDKEGSALLSALELRQLTEAFKDIDDDKSGKLDAGEIIEALRKREVEIDAAAVVRMVDEAGDADGELDLEQFLVYVARRLPKEKRGRRTKMNRHFWWRFLFGTSEGSDCEVMSEVSEAEGDEDEDDGPREARTRTRNGNLMRARPEGMLAFDAIRSELSTSQFANLKSLHRALTGEHAGARLSGEVLAQGMRRLGCAVSDEGGCAMIHAANAYEAGEKESKLSREPIQVARFVECLASRDCAALRGTGWEVWWQWFPALETSCEAALRAEATNPETRLTEQQRAHYADCFEEMDTNGDGSTSAVELRNTLVSLGVELSWDDAHAMIAMADTDGNGGVERDEFMAIMATLNGCDANDADASKKKGCKWQLWWRAWIKAARDEATADCKKPPESPSAARCAGRKGVKPIGGAGSFAGSPSSRVVSPTSSLPAHVSPSNSRRPSTPCSQALPSPASSPKRSSRELVPLVDCRGHRESPKHVSRELARLVEHPGVVGPRESARRCSRDLVSLVEPRGGPRESARRCSRASRTSCDISSLHRSTPYEPLDMREALTQLKHTINNGKVAVHTVRSLQKMRQSAKRTLARVETDVSRSQIELATPVNFPRELVAAYRGVFDAVDSNHDGGCDLREVVNRSGGAICTKTAVALFALGDADGNGVIDFPEFLGIVTAHEPPALAKCSTLEEKVALVHSPGFAWWSGVEGLALSKPKTVAKKHPKVAVSRSSSSGDFERGPDGALLHRLALQLNKKDASSSSSPREEEELPCASPRSGRRGSHDSLGSAKRQGDLCPLLFADPQLITGGLSARLAPLLESASQTSSETQQLPSRSPRAPPPPRKASQHQASQSGAKGKHSKRAVALEPLQTKPSKSGKHHPSRKKCVRRKARRGSEASDGSIGLVGAEEDEEDDTQTVTADDVDDEQSSSSGAGDVSDDLQAATTQEGLEEPARRARGNASNDLAPEIVPSLVELTQPDSSTDEETLDRRTELQAEVKELLSDRGGFVSAGNEGGLFLDATSGFLFGDTYAIGPPRRPRDDDDDDAETPLSYDEKMQRDWVLLMVLVDKKHGLPRTVRSICKELRVAGWRRNLDDWEAVVKQLGVAGVVRCTITEKGRAFEVYWPS